MPGFDQTGPTGQGSMTGRRMGKCTNYGGYVKRSDAPQDRSTDEQGPAFGPGYGRGGRGSGRGRRGGMRQRFGRTR